MATLPSNKAAQTKARNHTWTPTPTPAPPKPSAYYPGAPAPKPVAKPATSYPPVSAYPTASKPASVTMQPGFSRQIPWTPTSSSTAAPGSASKQTSQPTAAPPKPSAYYPGAPAPTSAPKPAAAPTSAPKPPPAAAPAQGAKPPVQPGAVARPAQSSTGQSLNTGNSKNINGGAYLEGVGKKAVDSTGESYEIKLAYDSYGNPFTYKESASTSANGTRAVAGLSKDGTILRSYKDAQGNTHIYDTRTWPNGKPTTAIQTGQVPQGRPTQASQPKSTPVNRPAPPPLTREEEIARSQGSW